MYDLYVTGKGSPTKLVQHSDALADVFANYVAALEHSPVRNSRIRKMKYAPHRFSSSTVPLQRSVLFFEAMWKFLIDVQATRSGTEPGRQATHFLGSCTAESLVQAAMMAEGADEHIQFRRFFDQSEWEATNLTHEIQRLLDNLSHLFIPQRGCKAACLNHGFVKYAIDLLGTPHVCWVGGRQHVLGGPGAVTDGMVGRCLSRMANWIRLTAAAASAEFPSWQLVNALDVLSLDRVSVDAPASDSARTHFARLSKAFDLDPNLLMEEFRRCLPAAKACFKKLGSCTDAWVRAYTISHKWIAARQASPLAMILHVAQGWIGLSTSKVEQTFGKVKSVTRAEIRHCSPSNESMEARLCSDLRDADEAFKSIVFREAGSIWAKLIPQQRQFFARQGTKRKLHENSEKRVLAGKARDCQGCH